MKLSQLFNINITAETDIDPEIKGISINSKYVKKGYIFFAIKGEKTDGNLHIDDAVKNGAVAVVTEKDVIRNDVKIIKVENARKTLAEVSSRFYSDPSMKMKTVGITGTKGKTSTASFAEQILNNLGFKCGIIGTINYRTPDRIIMDSPNTTPYPPLLDEIMNEFIKDGCNLCIMEVSSHALKLNKIDSVKFDRAIFTNLQSDHMDFHITMDDYKNSKLRLFEILENSPKNTIAIINKDDDFARDIIKLIKKSSIISYSINSESDLKACDIEITQNYTSFSILFSGEKYSVKTQIPGKHNILNILAASSLALSFGADIREIIQKIYELKPVKGRLEKIVSSHGFSIYIDYAHTEKSLKEVLSVLNGLPHKRIITVFGCGGDRDKTKRAPMGMVASQMSDFVIITSDNPRTEDPLSIILDIEKGIKQINMTNYEIIPDRSIAIEKAISYAADGDIIIIAGKGHEDYQIIGDKKIHFSDAEEVKKAMIKLSKI